MARNLITDVPGLKVGNAQDEARATGVTVIAFDQPAVAAVDVRGGGPGTRETDLLDPPATVERVDAIVISGGSAFGLDAATGVQAWMREQGRGFAIGNMFVPIVPGAALFDLLNGGDKNWGRFPPFRDMAYAASAAASLDVALGTVGAGCGATTATLKGGLGSASAVTEDGFAVGAIVAVNAVGNVTIADGPHFWAAPFEQNNEYGGRGMPNPWPADGLVFRTKGTERSSTTLAVVATDAALSKAQAKRFAIMAQDGLARAIYPIHTPLDGDVVFAASTGTRELPNPPFGLMRLGATAANVLARAVARGIYEARALPFAGALPAYKARFGEA